MLAIIPARSGSKGVPHKNIRSFRGKPLLAHSIDHARAARNVDRVLVSTDSEEYARIARAFGADVPFLRPRAISGDHATDLQTFEHALRWLAENERYQPSVCVHLRPTYPSRAVADVEAVVDLLLGHPEADSVRSVALAPHTPYKMWRLDESSGYLQPLLATKIPEAHSLPRQALPPVYLQNAAVDAVRARVILDQHSMAGSRVLAYPMAHVLDIDTDLDFEMAASDLGERMPTGKTFVFDLDGVIAQIAPGNDYTLSLPNEPVIALVNALHDGGNTIVVHTARGSLTGIDWSETTAHQLRRWGVKHHRLALGKPAGDFYVDDRMIALSALQRWMGTTRNGGC